MENSGQLKIIKASSMEILLSQFPQSGNSGNILNNVAALPISQGNRLDTLSECQ